MILISGVYDRLDIHDGVLSVGMLVAGTARRLLGFWAVAGLAEVYGYPFFISKIGAITSSDGEGPSL